MEDVDNATVSWYNYDSLGRLISSYQTIGEDVNSLYYYTYDDKSRATRLYYTISGTAGGVFEQIYSYAYDDADDTLTALNVQNGSSTSTISYTYDYLKRLSTKSYGNFTQTYNYKMLSDTRTSTLIDEFKWTMGNTELRYNYTYDELGNISEIKENNTTVASYTYDEQGQLLSETLPQENIKNVYVYDTYGNIRSVKKYDLTSNTLLSEDAYGYSNSSWLDRLTAFNGVTITYDDAGNPLSYYNGSAYTLTWQNGRELATATKNGVTSSYKYNIDGQRVQKTVGDVVYDYYYADGLLVRQTWGSNCIDFLYDESGVFSFVYNGTQYYYIKNLQGDIVAIANSNGTILVEYVYDAWGDIISITGTEASTIGAINPIRYRGYYFDTDTEFYYLNSRYYDPEIRRFINADDVSMLGANADFASLNLYAYCGNNPVARADNGGEFWNLVIGAAVGGIVGGLASAASQLIENPTSWKTKQFWGSVGVASASGVVTGLVAATGVGLAGQVAWNAGTSVVSSIIDTAIVTDGKADLGTYVINATESAMFGTVAGLLGGAGSGNKHLTNAWNKVWHNNNWSYYFTQVTTESVRSGIKAINPIFKGIIPSMSKAIIKKINSFD